MRRLTATLTYLLSPVSAIPILIEVLRTCAAGSDAAGMLERSDVV